MKFSVVIPTLDRAPLLGNALRSALDQRDVDHEVLVSNNHSSDATEAVVRELSAPNLRYVETDRTLSMVDHWEFALEKAQGDWILILCDDDALVPDALARLSRVAEQHPDAEVMRYRKAIYCYDDGVERTGNYIRYKQASADRVRVVDSRRTLEGILGSLRGHGPRYLNCAVRRRLVERIRSRHGRAFWEWAPDISGGALLLAHTPSFLDLTRVLMLWGKNLGSYGSGSAADPAHLRRFLEQFDAFSGRLQYTGHPELLTVTNMVLDTLGRVREQLGGEWSGMRPDPAAVLPRLRDDLVNYLAHGHAACREPLEAIQRELEALPAAHPARPRRGKTLRKRLKSALRGAFPRLDRTRIIESPHAGEEFHDIYQAVKVFHRHELR